MPPNCHRGALADITDYEERDSAVLAHLHELDKQRGESLLDVESFMDNRCDDGPSTTSLTELLIRERKQEMKSFAQVIRNMSIDDLDFDPDEKPELKESFERLKREAEEMENEEPSVDESDVNLVPFTDVKHLQKRVSGLSEGVIEGVRMMVEHDGRMSVPIADIKSLRDVPDAVHGVVHIFREGDSYEFVMPDEVLPVARLINWDEVKTEMQRRKDLVKFFDELCELRDIVELEEAAEGYLSAIPNGYQSVETIFDTLSEEVEEDRCSACILDTEELSYLLHYELLWEYRDAKGLDRYDDSPIEEGELDELLEGLLRRQNAEPQKGPVPSGAKMRKRRPMVRAPPGICTVGFRSALATIVSR